MTKPLWLGLKQKQTNKQTYFYHNSWHKKLFELLHRAHKLCLLLGITKVFLRKWAWSNRRRTLRATKEGIQSIGCTNQIISAVHATTRGLRLRKCSDKKKTTNGPKGTATANMARLLFGMTARSFLNTCKDEAMDSI